MRALRAVLFALVWFSCTWFGSWESNPNNATRLFAAISLVEDGDATIDEFADMTIDKARFGEHFYLDKAPGMTLLAIPAVAIADAVTGQRAADLPKLSGRSEFGRFLRTRQRIAVAIGPALLTALAAVLLLDLGATLTGSVAAGLFAALGFALGTPAWGWSTTLLGHAPVASLFVVAVWATLRRSIAGAALTGAALGLAIGIEYQAVVAGGVIAGWAVGRWWALPDRWPFVAAATAAGIAALVPVGLYDQVAFGTPWRIGYSGVVGWAGMHQGVFGIGVPSPKVLWAITFGTRRGLIWVAPVLLLAPLGLAAWCRDRERRGLVAVIALASAAILCVNAGYVYWDGGNSTGPRLAIPLVGILSLGLAPAWRLLEAARWRIPGIALLGLSIALDAAIAAADVFAPPEYRFPIWSDVLAGRFASGEIATLGSDYAGLSPWMGFAVWLVVAAPTLVWLAARAGNDRCRQAIRPRSS